MSRLSSYFFHQIRPDKLGESACGHTSCDDTWNRIFEQLSPCREPEKASRKHTTAFYSLDLGKDPATKSDEFLEKCQRGGGHFQSKNLYCRFWEL